jgi:hypothetical protein
MDQLTKQKVLDLRYDMWQEINIIVTKTEKKIKDIMEEKGGYNYYKS